MDFLLYFVGLVIGLILFLYIFTSYESGKEKLKKRFSDMEKTVPPPRTENLEPQEVGIRDAQTYPRERICPLCRARLTRYEALYASMMERDNDRKILIYGCRYCYRPEEDPEERKKSLL